MNQKPTTLLHAIVNACWSLLFAAVALWLAVQILCHLWIYLAILTGIAGLIAGLIAAWRTWQARQW